MHINYLFKRIILSFILFSIAGVSIAQVPCQTDQEIAEELV